MRIVFATTQSLLGSTMIGRVLPIAKSFTSQHNVHILGFSASTKINKVSFHNIGKEPFTRTKSGKKRLSGLGLVLNMLQSVFFTTLHLWRLKPDMVIIVKTLPHNVLGVRLWHLFHPTKKIIIDVDDFELSANKLSSLSQRFSVHYAERAAVKMSNCLIAASPFLLDHFSNLRKDINAHLIPTGVAIPDINTTIFPPHTLIFLGSTSISSGHRVDLLPEILKLVKEKDPNVKLIIAGSGDDTRLLKDEFRKKNLSSFVHWHGRFSFDQLPALLSQSTLIVDPIDASISNRAKSSFRVSLAAAVGMPVVSSNVGIRPKLLPVQLHNQFFADPGSPSDYADKITSLLRDSLSDTEKKLMKATSQSYTWPVLTKKYLSIIEQC